MTAHWDGHGGLQNLLHDFAIDLARDRRVTVLSWGRHPRQPSPAPPGVRVTRLPTPWAWDADLTPRRARINTLAAMITGIATALAMHRRWAVAVSSGLHPDGVVVAVAALTLGRKFIVKTWLVGPLGNVARLGQSIGARPLTRLLGAARWFVAETDEAAGELREAGFEGARVVVVADPIDVERWAPVTAAERAGARAALGLAADSKVVACWSRFDLRQKRIDLLLDAWRDAGIDGWHLVVAGDGPDRAAIQKRALDLDPPVVFPGWRQDPRDIAAAAEIIACPTEVETSALSLLEGMAMGLPAIASATSGLVSRAPAGTILVPNRASDWSVALRALASDEERRATLGTAARAWVVEHHGAAHVAAQWRALLDSRPTR